MSWLQLPDETPEAPLVGGTYYVEIRKVETQKSRAGDTQIVLTLRDVETQKELARDFLTFAPGFAERLAKTKLGVFGINLGEKNRGFDPDELQFKRAYCALVPNTYKDKNGNEKTGLKVDEKVGTGGYWAESSPPPGLKPAAKADDGGVPF